MEVEPIVVGPWGSQDGIFFHHKDKGGVKKIVMIYERGFKSLRIQYSREEAEEWVDVLSESAVLQGEVVATGSPVNLLKNPDFSQELQFWELNNCEARVASGSIGVTPGAYGNYAVVTSRRSPWSNLIQDITNKIYSGITYDLSALVRVNAPEDHKFVVMATLHIRSPTSGDSFLHLGRVTASRLRWERLECSFFLTSIPSQSQMKIFFEGPPASVDLLVGVVSLRPSVPKKFEVNLDYPKEYLTSISGHYGQLQDNTEIERITSLTFTSNLSKYGPFGGERGKTFDFQMSDGEIVGFHGRVAKYLCAIGLYIKPTVIAGHSICTIPKLSLAEDCTRSIKELNVGGFTLPREPGPWGGKGEPFDDGIFHGIKQILLHGEQNAVHSLQIQYDRDGESSWSPTHGGIGGGFVNRIEFEQPDEYLVRITGFYSPLIAEDRNEVIKSLTLYSNKGKYGPVGEEIGTFFSSPIACGKVCGFFGRSGKYLTAIGVHMEYF